MLSFIVCDLTWRLGGRLDGRAGGWRGHHGRCPRCLRVGGLLRSGPPVHGQRTVLRPRPRRRRSRRSYRAHLQHKQGEDVLIRHSISAGVFFLINAIC